MLTFSRRAFLVACLVLAWTPLACRGAQSGPVVVHKKDGGRVEGRVIDEQPAWIMLQTRFGRLKLFRTDILNVTPGITKETIFARRRARIRDSDATALLKLANWCLHNGLRREALDTYQAAAAVAGPHYLEANFAVAKLAMQVGEYRLAVERYLDLAVRLKQDSAWKALRNAEAKLRKERLEQWRAANAELEQERYQRAIAGFCNTLHRTVSAQPELSEDVGRVQVEAKILATRRRYYQWLREKLPEAPVIETDPGGISWHYSPRPRNLRGRSWSVTMRRLRLETERYTGRWLALTGKYLGLSRWNNPRTRCIRMLASGHANIAVAACLPAARILHRNMLESRRRGSAYLEELLRCYPYKEIGAAMDLLTPGREIVCYGRLRKREHKLPQYVFEIWETEAVLSPQAATLAEYLKTPLSCEFEQTPLSQVLSHIEMLSRVKVEFAGTVPDVPVSLVLANKPAGFAIHKLAGKLGLQWTRRGTSVLMKKELTPREKLLQKQVRRLATDTAGK